MKSLFYFKSLNNNRYLYNYHKKQIIYIPPEMDEIILKLKGNSFTGKDFKNNYKNNQKSDKTNQNYLNKVKYFSQNDLFKDFDILNKVEKISPDMILDRLANITQVTFEVTESCNFNCKYCGYGELYSDYGKRECKDLDTNTAIRLLKFLITFWNSPLNVSHNKGINISFYGGEPMLNITFIKEIVRFMSISNLKHNHVHFGMTTNGFLLKKHIEFLVDNDFSLTVSLDGNEYNNRYRILKNGLESFNVVFENLIFIKDKYPEFFKSKIKFNSVLHNKNSVEDIISFFDNKIGKIPTISPLNESGINKEKINEFYKMYVSKNESVNSSKKIDYVKEKMEFDLPGYYETAVLVNYLFGNTYRTYNDFLKNSDTGYIKRIPTGTCFPFSKKLFLTAQGKVFVCERIGHQFSLGNVTEDKINLDFENIANTYNKYYSSLREQCEKCYKFPICLQCIFNIDNLTVNPKCREFCNYTSFVNYLRRIISNLEENNELYTGIMKKFIIT